MYYINPIDFFSIDVNVCAQKSLKPICPGFDLITPPDCIDIFHSTWLCAVCWYITRIQENSIICFSICIG